MVCKTKRTGFLLILFAMLIIGPLSNERYAFGGVKVITERTYLATNLHADRGSGRLSSVNYQVIGTLIKWGTPVKIIMNYSYDDTSTEEYRLIDLSNNTDHMFTIHGRTLKYMTPVQYFDSITTEDLIALKNKVDQLSKIDKFAIEKGIVIEGMSKDAVLIAIGIPPIFANPSPDRSNIWQYWHNRRNIFKVNFDNDGKVSSVTGRYPKTEQYVPLPNEDEKKDEITTSENQDVDNIKQRLENLKKLYDEKLITKEDYERKKAEILSEF